MLESLEENLVLRERYKLTDIVGQGGMGYVYRAEDLRLPGRLCAIKEVKPDQNASAEVKRQEQIQFLREASLLAQLDHPNLPKVSDFFTSLGKDYLVMDFVPGKDLKELLDESRARGENLKVHTVLHWAAQILDAVAYLHSQDPQILHRDIKPANIKLTPDNRIKLVDFGLAKVLVGDDSATITIIQGRGTAYYTPLEQYGAESEHTDVRSDIYALGATFYHLLAGVPPPEAKRRFLNPNSLQPLNRLNPDVSQSLAEAINWALEMHPDARPDSVNTFQKALFGQISRPTSQGEPSSEDHMRAALEANSTLLIVVLLLLFVAVVFSLLQS